MANIDLDALSTETPDNRMALINGSKLVCYPKVIQPKSFSKDNLTLDESGKYLKVGSKPIAENNKVDIVEMEDFFYKNAFLFFRNAHRIMNDSRMFLAPVPIQSGLAYTGTSGFNNPTLGVYIEWWLNCDVNITKDKEGSEALTCQFVGSPLSGSNRCTCVYPDGKTVQISHNHFVSVWSSFGKINARYTAAKQMYEAYTLHEVAEILQAAGQSRELELETQLDIAERNTNKLRSFYSHLMERYSKLQCQYNDLCILHHKEELEEFRVEYRKRKHDAEMEKESLAVAKAEIRSQMKQGLINNVEYQQAINPLTRRKKSIERELKTFRKEKSAALVAKGHISYSQIYNYIDQDEKKSM